MDLLLLAGLLVTSLVTIVGILWLVPMLALAAIATLDEDDGPAGLRVPRSRAS